MELNSDKISPIMLKLGVNARILSDPALRGWSRYTVNLLRELSELGVDLFLYSDAPLSENHLAALPKGSFHERVSRVKPYFLWEQVWLPKQCLKDKIDLLHCPFNFGLPRVSSCPRVLTLHDAIHEVQVREKGGEWGWKYWVGQTYFWIAKTSAERILTVSEHAKQDLIKYLGITEEKIKVVYEAADPLFHKTVSSEQREGVRKEFGLKNPYFFYIGGWEKRKNLSFLIQAFAHALLEEVDLVLAGGGDAASQEQLKKIAGDLGISSRVRFLGRIEDAKLPALYAGALSFVYPSSYEGFGLQICEALAVGCPVLAARATSLPEVLGAGGEFFELSDEKTLVELLRKMVSNQDYLNEMRIRAKTRSLDFSWKKTALETLKVYEEILK